MSSLRVPGHRLEVVATHGGLLAACSCGHVHHPPTGRAQTFPSWDRPRIRVAHQAHLRAVSVTAG